MSRDFTYKRGHVRGFQESWPPALPGNGSDVPAPEESAATTPIPLHDVQQSRTAIEELLRNSLRQGVHYGPLPGTDRMILLQPGAEKLQAFFHLAPSYTVDDRSTADHRRYIVTCLVSSVSSGLLLGSAVAEASTDEDKYGWRRAICEQEFEEAPPDRRRVHWARGKGGAVEPVRQVRTNAADLANTVLAMACKRAQVRAIRGVLAVSDLFAADRDDAAPTGDVEAPGAGSGPLLTFGKYEGKTLGQVRRQDPGYVKWLAENAKEPAMRAAAAAMSARAPAAAPAAAREDIPPASDEDAPPFEGHLAADLAEDATDPFADQ